MPENKAAGAMFIKIIANNKSGTLAKISRILARAKINIEHINATELSERVIISFSVSDPHRAAQILQKAGYYVLEERGIVITVRDEPGALARVAQRLFKAGVNLTSTSAIGRSEDLVYIALTTTNSTKARNVLAGVEVHAKVGRRAKKQS